MNFTQYSLSEEMQRGLAKMNFTVATPVQEQTISPMLEKRDLLVQSPTGSGKTCAFGIPAIEAADTKSRDIQTVILCPTRELALQTTAVLQNLTFYKHGIKIIAIYGGEPIGRQIAALRKQPQIVVATPGRLMDHIGRRTVKLGKVDLVVMDEADRMLDMGFREDMDTILESIPQARQTVLFSATLSGAVQEVTQSYQTDAQIIRIGQESRTVDTVKQFYLEVQAGGKPQVLETLLRERSRQRALVFVGTKSMADSLSEKLIHSGLQAEALHGGLRQVQRDKVMSRFRKGATRVLVATDVAARGIDVRDMETVINYDIPGSSDDYVHRIGRTGRANASGVAYTFLYAKERGLLKTIMRETKADIRIAEIQGVLPTSDSLQSQRTAQKPRYLEKKQNCSRNGSKRRHAAAG